MYRRNLEQIQNDSRSSWALLRLFTVLGALVSFSACGGRTPLNYDEERDPIAPEPCAGWKGDYFLTSEPDSTVGDRATILALHSSNGDGTFGSPTRIDMKEPYSGVVIDDFDNDSSLEIHVWGLTSNVEYLLDYSCPDELWYVRPNFDGDAPPRHEFSSIGDVNNDGYVDVVGWIPAEDDNGEPNVDAFDVYVSFGGPGGRFTHQKSGLNLKEKFVWWLAATSHIRDMDGDGCADLIFIKYDHGGTAKSSIFLSPGDCSGHFAEPQKILSMPFPGTGNDIGDIDGDGNMDLITGLDDDGDPGQSWVAKGDGFGSLGEPIPVFDAVTEEKGHDGAGFGQFFIYDWDKDGLLDVLSAYTTGSSFSNPRVDLRMNQGDLTFGAPSIVVPSPRAFDQWLVGPASQ